MLIIWRLPVDLVRRVTFAKLFVTEALNVSDVPDITAFLLKMRIGLPFVNCIAELLLWSLVAETAESDAVDIWVFL